jgi:glycine cleavage system regulatory protein
VRQLRVQVVRVQVDAKNSKTVNDVLSLLNHQHDLREDEYQARNRLTEWSDHPIWGR